MMFIFFHFFVRNSYFLHLLSALYAAVSERQEGHTADEAIQAVLLQPDPVSDQAEVELRPAERHVLLFLVDLLCTFTSVSRLCSVEVLPCRLFALHRTLLTLVPYVCLISPKKSNKILGCCWLYSRRALHSISSPLGDESHYCAT